MRTLYLCGGGNPEGVKLAITVNRSSKRWDRIVVLDDDPAKQGRLVLGVEIAGTFEALSAAEPDSEVASLVARTTQKRQAVFEKISAYGLSFASLIDPRVDIFGVNLGVNMTVYPHAIFLALATVEEGSVIFPGAVIGHGCHVGRGCVIAPGAVISARVEIGEGVYVGTNSTILPDLKIGPWAAIGANSAVIEDVPSGALVMGVPAQVIGKPNLAAAPIVADRLASPVSDKQASTQMKVPPGALGRLQLAQREFLALHRP